MRTGVSAVLSGVIALCTVWQTGGCGAGLANLVPEQAVDFDLGVG